MRIDERTGGIPMTTLPPLPPEMEQLRAVGEREAVAILGISLQTARNWRHLGRGPRYCKYGRAVRYLVADLLAWREQHRITPRKEMEGRSSRKLLPVSPTCGRTRERAVGEFGRCAVLRLADADDNEGCTAVRGVGIPGLPLRPRGKGALDAPGVQGCDHRSGTDPVVVGEISECQRRNAYGTSTGHGRRWS